MPAPLAERGREEARLLGAQLANVELDLCVHTRFERTRETAELALEGRDVPVEVGAAPRRHQDRRARGRAASRATAKRSASSAASDPFPGGESLDEAALRYAEAFARLGRVDAERVLVVCHEIPVRYALNAAAGVRRARRAAVPRHRERGAVRLRGRSARPRGRRIRELAA